MKWILTKGKKCVKSSWYLLPCDHNSIKPCNFTQPVQFMGYVVGILPTEHGHIGGEV